jgi:hypothetical protein
MQQRIALVFTLAAIVGGVGCATEPMITHIKSEPSAAKIEVNEDYVGTTPVDVTLPQTGKHHRLKQHVTVRAIPVDPGQYAQEKQFFYNQWAPENVVFDMTRQSSTSK